MLDILRTASTPPRELVVVPMFSDGPWPPEEVATYASLLRVAPTALRSAEPLTPANRASYFAGVCPREADAFVDPDTGIARSPRGAAHASPEELLALAGGTNVVAVYQHAPRQPRTTPWVAEYKALVATPPVEVVTCASAGVAMLFLTRSAVRANDLRRQLGRRLGAAATVRGDIPARVL